MHDGTLQRVALTVARHEVCLFLDVGLVGPGVEHEIVVALFSVEDDPVGEQARGGGAIDHDDDGLACGNGGIDQAEGGVCVVAGDAAFDADLRHHLADRSPADACAGEAADRL